MMELVNILLAVALVSLVSLAGVLYLWTQPLVLQKILPYLVAFATGILLAVGFLELVPEGFEHLGDTAPVWIVVGILGFFVFEKLVHWHHRHDGICENDQHQATGYAVLAGDGMHNFLDGLLIASAFAISPQVGWAATIAILAHEIPQELSDYAVLVHSGFSSKTALWFNLLSALTAIAGGLLGYWFIERFESVASVITAIGAGGFIYIALVDLLSEMREKHEKRVFWWGEFVLVIFAVVLYIVIQEMIKGVAPINV